MSPPSRESSKQTSSANLTSIRKKTPGVDTKVVPRVPSGAISQNSMEFKTSDASRVLGDADDTESDTEREKMKLAVQDKMAEVKATVSALPILPIKYEGTKHKVELMKLRRRPYENGVTNPRKRFDGVEKVVDDNKAIKRYKAILNSLSKSLAQCDKYINRLLQLEDGGEQDGKDEKSRECADDDDCIIVESPSVKRQKIGKHEAVKSSKTLLIPDTSLDSTESRQPLSSSKAISAEARISQLRKEHEEKLNIAIEKVIKEEEEALKKEEALKRKKEEEEALKKEEALKRKKEEETLKKRKEEETLKKEKEETLKKKKNEEALKKEKEEALKKKEEEALKKKEREEVVFKKKDTFKKMKESARKQENMLFGSGKRRQAALKMAKDAEAKKVADDRAAFKNAVKLSKAKKANKKLLMKEKVGTMVFLKAVKVSKDKQAKDQALTETSVINSLTPTIKQELADVVSSTLLILAIRIPSDVVLSAIQELFVYTWDELSAQSILNTELSAAFRSILLTGLRARPLLLDYMNTALYMDAAFYTYSQSSTPIPLDALIVHALNKI